MPKKRTKKSAGRRRPPLRGFVERALELGAKKARIVKAASIITAPWVRLKCRYGCGGFDTSLCCPPHTPTPEEMRAVLDGYKSAVLFEAEKGNAKTVAVKLERDVFLAGYYKAFGLGAGGCRLCREGCAFHDGCRHAREVRPAMEACGIDVYKTARGNGFDIDVVRTRKDEAHYFGAVLVD